MNRSTQLQRKHAKEVQRLIHEKALKDLMLERTYESLLDAIISGKGYVHLVDGKVAGYAEYAENKNFCKIFSVVANEQLGKNGFGTAVMNNRLQVCKHKCPGKKVILACSIEKSGWYERFGFETMLKIEAPHWIRGGRIHKAWMTSDRVWMMLKEKEK